MLLQNIYKMMRQWIWLVDFNTLTNEYLNYFFVIGNTFFCKSHDAKFVFLSSKIYILPYAYFIYLYNAFYVYYKL